MKVAELRQKIQTCSKDKLEHMILEIYKAIPKSLRETKGIDSIINNPNAKPAKPSAPVRRDLEEIRCETEEFVSDAYNQYYFAPNSVVPKSKRPGWRFIARRLFKELCEAAKNQDDAAAAAGLLESLYKMLCYSCSYVLFSGYDSFDSVGIRQVEFFQAILDVERKIKPPREFIRNSVLLALGNNLNRYTLWEELLEDIVARLDTVDTKEMAIEICDELRKDAAAGGLRNLEPFSDGRESYRARDFINHLAILGWMCHMALDQTEDAVGYFRRHYAEKNQEIALYVLLRMIEHRELWPLWIRTYHEALSRGVCPREELHRLSMKIQQRQDDRQNIRITE
jgi:hypothetical protein